jgi:hypothetical protein
VVERIPVPVYSHTNNDRLISFHVRELLECGHRLIAYPTGDPLVAQRRVCPECESEARTGLAGSPKKPCVSVSSPDAADAKRYDFPPPMTAEDAKKICEKYLPGLDVNQRELQKKLRRKAA